MYYLWLFLNDVYRKVVRVKVMMALPMP